MNNIKYIIIIDHNDDDSKKFDTIDELFDNAKIGDKLIFTDDNIKQKTRNNLYYDTFHCDSFEFDNHDIFVIVRCNMFDRSQIIAHDGQFYCENIVKFESKNKPFIQCYICSDYYNDDVKLIDNYCGYMICHHCVSSYQSSENHKKFSLKKIPSEQCSICFEDDDKTFIELQNCIHHFCIDCYKKLKFIHASNYDHNISKSEPIFPYDDIDKYSEFLRWYYDDDNSEEYFDENTKNKRKNKIRKNRNGWMNNDEMLQYEIKLNDFHIARENNGDKDLDDNDIDREHKCPLCRTVFDD